MCDFEPNEQVYSAYEGKVWRWHVVAWLGNGRLGLVHRGTKTAKVLKLSEVYKSKKDAEAALVAK